MRQAGIGYQVPVAFQKCQEQTLLCTVPVPYRHQLNNFTSSRTKNVFSRPGMDATPLPSCSCSALCISCTDSAFLPRYVPCRYSYAYRRYPRHGETCIFQNERYTIKYNRRICMKERKDGSQLAGNREALDTFFPMTPF